MFWRFLDWWIGLYDDLVDRVLDIRDKLTTTKNIKWYHKKVMRKLRRRSWIKKWFGRYNWLLWIAVVFYATQTVLASLDGVWALIVGSMLYVVVLVVWAYRRGQSTYRNMIASVQASSGATGTSLMTMNAIVQGQPPLTAAQARAAVAYRLLQASGGPYNFVRVGGKKTGRVYGFPPSLNAPWSPSMFLQAVSQRHAQGGGSMAAPYNRARFPGASSSTPLNPAQAKALQDAVNKATAELRQKSIPAFDAMRRAMESFAGTWEEAMRMALAVCSEMGIQVEPPELSEPQGVDIAGYVYGLRMWTAVTVSGNTSWEEVDFTTTNEIADQWLEKWKDKATSWVVAPMNGGDPWTRGENIAICANNMDHAVTHPNCGCGFWAFWTIEALDEAFNLYGGFVSGIIRGYGNVLEASLGFRTEKAEIIGFLLNPEDKQTWPALQELAVRYQVAVYRYGLEMDEKTEGRRRMFEKYWDEGLHTTVPGQNPFSLVYVPPGVDPIPIPQPSTWRPA